MELIKIIDYILTQEHLNARLQVNEREFLEQFKKRIFFKVGIDEEEIKAFFIVVTNITIGE